MATLPIRPKAPARSTYRTLKSGRAAILALDALLLLTIVLGARVHREAVLTIGRDAAPGIIAAQHIKAALAGMDADEASELLAPPDTASAATSGIVRRRIETEDALLVAAGNIAYPGEREAIETLQVTGALYNRLAQQAEDLHDAGDPGDVNAYRADAIIMDNALLSAADDLDRVNEEQMQQAYHREAVEGTLATALAALAGLAVLTALLAAQSFLSRRTRRTVNPLLLLATLTTLALAGYTVAALMTEQHQLKIAREDAFESLHVLWQARAVAYQARAQESRLLLDPPRGPVYERAFAQDTGSLARIPEGVSVDELLLRVGREKPMPGFTGYLADELNNITFHGERDAAVRALAAYENYLRLDAEMRALERAGKHQQAVELCIGSSPGQEERAFEQFDQALGETLALNQEAFNGAIAAGLSAVGSMSGRVSAGELVSTLEFKAVVVSILIAVLVLLGYAPRLREYE